LLLLGLCATQTPVTVDFYKMETICFNMSVDFLVCRERRKATCALHTILQQSLQSTSFWVLSCSCSGDLSDLLPVLVFKTGNATSTTYMYFHRLSQHSLHQTITIIQSHINAKTSWLGNSGECGKTFTFPAPNNLPKPSVSIALELGLILYM
jgi:hypothetical protein